MTLNRKHFNFAQVAIMAVLALTVTGSIFAQDAEPAVASTALYVDTMAALNTTSQVFVPITGLSFDLPAASTKYNAALVTLDLPALYLSGTASGGTLGGEIGVLLSGVTVVAIGQVSCDSQTSGPSGRKPGTIVVRISLLSGPQSVEGVWTGVRGSTMNTDTFGSLSAVLIHD